MQINFINHWTTPYNFGVIEITMAPFIKYNEKGEEVEDENTICFVFVVMGLGVMIVL